MAKPSGRKKFSYAELQARAELARRAIADAHVLMEGADPIGDPRGFAERETKARALLEEATTVLPLGSPLEPEERARLAEELEGMPDNQTLRALLLECERMCDDPAMPAEVRDSVSKEQIRAALSALDEVAVIKPVARDAEALLASLQSGGNKPDPRAAALRAEVEKSAARRRS